MTSQDDKGEHRFFKRILVATDFSEHSGRAVETAAGIAHACNPESLVILHVFDVSGLPIIQSYPYYYGKVNKAMLDEIRMRAERALADLAEPYLKTFPQATARVETGRTPFVILEAAREMDAELIILGVAGLGGKRTGMGSTALKVIRRSRCPVLVAQHVPSRSEGKAADEEATGEDARHLRRMKREARKRLKREQRRSRRRFRFRRKKRKDDASEQGANEGVGVGADDGVGEPDGKKSPDGKKTNTDGPPEESGPGRRDRDAKAGDQEGGSPDSD